MKSTRRVGRGLVRFFLLFPVLGTLVHSACYVSDCDDDGSDDCDDDGHNNLHHPARDPGAGISALPLSENDAEELRLRTFEIVPSTDLRSHPVRKVVRIEGISIFSQGGSGEYGKEELHQFTERILDENEDLLRVPASSGRLRFAGVAFLEEAIRVTYVQERPALSGVSGRVHGARMIFAFDRLGNLIEIDNTTRIELD